MKLNRKLLSVVALSVFSQASNAIPFTFEGRSLGMGGASVATADLASAAWANPAMLTNQRPSDDFSLLIGVGAFLRDNDDLITDIDSFQDADALREAGIAAMDVPGAIQAAQAVIDMSSIIAGIDGKVMAPEVTGVVAMGIAFESFAMAISVRADVIAAGTVTDLSCSLVTDPTCNVVRLTSEISSTNFNILNLEGLFATELGLSFAKDFQVFERKVSIGIKPKIVELTSFTFRESLLTVDAGLDTINKDDVETDIGTFATVDFGAAADVTESIRLGLSVRNLITDDFAIDLGTINGAPLQGVLNFDIEARIGAAYHNDVVTVAVDFDLTENEPLLANPAFNKLTTQYLAVGAEFNAFDFMQLRVGAVKNVASGISDGAKDVAYTAGLGFWLGFNLDIAATFNDNAVGGFIQTGFRF